MGSGATCPKCGAALTEEQSAAGECPRCAMRLALADSPTAPLEPTGEERTAGGIPGQIGPYRIVRSVGEGGMGEVFLAEQTGPIRRDVAIKVIKRGLDTRQVVARFEAERQALARMDHPTIARVHDAGETEDGRPYFVMEFVAGEPITDYADGHRLTIRERLDLFRKVCEGVQHAHQKGVIHRDLKPSNILVTGEGDRATPKIIDFGVAKAISKRLAEETIFTEIGIMIGTPEYMSPEQAEVSAIDVDTRSDVYSLGVLLYELLTGALPFESAALRRAGYDEIRRRIREDDPAPPSSRISTLGDSATTTASLRRSNLTSFRRELTGDLDWITLKALEKKPGRRYESPLGLADDIERHLTNRPVVARPPSTLYLMGKFVRRHRVVVIVAVALLVALGVSVVQAHRGRLLAERSRDESEAVSRFLADTLHLADPNRSGGEITVKEAIDRVAPSIEQRFEDRPLVQARLLYVVGDAYVRLGSFDRAQETLERSLEIRLERLGANHAATAETLNMLGVLNKERGDYDAALRMYERALAARRRALGPYDALTGETLNNLAVVYQKRREYDRARDYLEQALEIRKRRLGPRHEMVGRSLTNLGALHFRIDEYERARDYFEQALAIQEETLGENHPALTVTLGNLGVVSGMLGDREGAIRALERTLKVRENAFGPDHPDVAITLLGLGEEYQAVGRYDEAYDLFDRAIAICEEKLPADHERTSYARMDLGKLYLETDRIPEAIEQLEAALAADQRRAGPDDLSLVETLEYLARSFHAVGDGERASATIDRALAIGEAELGEDNPALDPLREIRESIRSAM